jgi:hypothetical protein
MVRLEPGDFVEVPAMILHAFAADPSADEWNISVTNPPFEVANMTFEPELDAKIHADFEEAFATSKASPR